MAWNVLVILMCVLAGSWAKSPQVFCRNRYCTKDQYCHIDSDQKERCRYCAYLQDQCLADKLPDRFHEGCGDFCKRRIVQEVKAKAEKDIRCPNSTSFEHGITIAETTTVGSHLQIKCSNGFEIATGNQTVVCLPNGRWNMSAGLSCTKTKTEDPNNHVKIDINILVPIVVVTAVTIVLLSSIVLYCYCKTREHISTTELRELIPLKNNRNYNITGTNSEEDPSTDERSRLTPNAPAWPYEDDNNGDIQPKLQDVNHLQIEREIVSATLDAGKNTEKIETNPPATGCLPQGTQQAAPMSPRVTSDVDLHPNDGEDQQFDGATPQVPESHENEQSANTEIKFKFIIPVTQTSNVTIHNGTVLPNADQSPGRHSPVPTTSAVQVSRSGSQSSGISSMSADSGSGPIQEEGIATTDYNKPDNAQEVGESM